MEPWGILRGESLGDTICWGQGDLGILYVDASVSLSVGPLQVTPEVRPEVTTLGHPEVIPE